MSSVTDLHTPLLYSNLHFINSYDAKSNATCWLHCFFFSLLAFPENLGEIAETNKYYSAVGYYIHTSRVARLRRATASNACTPMLSATMLLLQLKNNDYRFKFERRTTANQLVNPGNR